MTACALLGCTAACEYTTKRVSSFLLSVYARGFLEAAAAAGTRVRVTYLRDRDEKSVRVLKPISVAELSYAGVPYLGVKAFCETFQAVRTFKVERLRPNPCAYADLDAYVAVWRDALLHALCALQADEAADMQARAPKRGHPQFKAHKAYALRAWRLNAERMLARHWPTRAA